jgi:hypothetical protein
MMANIGPFQKPMWVSGLLVSSLVFSSILVASQNVTRHFLPHGRLCKLANNTCTPTNEYRNCRNIPERDECESGWAWLFCRQPEVSECYWEVNRSRCTSVSDRNRKDNVCPNITNQQECEDKFWFIARPASSVLCYWKESEGHCASHLLAAVEGLVKFEYLDDLNYLDHLDPRVCQELVHVALRDGVCGKSQIHTGANCLAIMSQDKVNNGKVRNDIVSAAVKLRLAP